jgi:hypothetical protein
VVEASTTCAASLPTRVVVYRRHTFNNRMLTVMLTVMLTMTVVLGFAPKVVES